MSDKPSYLGLLNAVSLAETAAHEYLTAWAAVTPHEGVKATLLTVAAREGEHGMSFAKRINELGYNLRPGPDDPKRAERMAIACSTEISDYDKMHALGVARIAEDVGEERPGHLRQVLLRPLHRHPDRRAARSLHRRRARQRSTAAGVLPRRQGRPRRRGCARMESRRSATRMCDRLEDKIDELCAAVEQLQRSIAPAAKNGRSRAKATVDH